WRRHCEVDVSVVAMKSSAVDALHFSTAPGACAGSGAFTHGCTRLQAWNHSFLHLGAPPNYPERLITNHIKMPWPVFMSFTRTMPGLHRCASDLPSSICL